MISKNTAQTIAKQMVAKYPALAGDARVGRAINLAPFVEKVDEGLYAVPSKSRPNLKHQVNTDLKTCVCEDAQKGHVCMHRMAVHITRVATNQAPL